MISTTDSVLRYHLRLEGVGRRTLRTMAGDINSALEEIERQIRKRAGTETFTLDRLTAVRGEIVAAQAALSERLSGAVSGAQDAVLETVGPATRNAFKVAEKGVVADFTMVPVDALAAVKDIPADGLSWSRWGDDLGVKTMRRVESELRQAVSLGERLPDVRKRLERVGDLSRASAEKLARTSLNSTGNRARQRTMQANRDISDRWRFVATLDSASSLICAGLDGQVFSVDDGSAPFPPRHPNCRSAAVPMLIGQEDLAGDRAAAGGPVKSKTKFETFLRRQDRAFQVEAFGSQAKWRAWKNGVPLDAFATVDRELSLGELKRLYPKELETA